MRIRSQVLQSVFDAYFRDDPERLASLESEFLNAEIAQSLYDLRHELGLSHEELAQRLGVDSEVISDIEEADFEGDAMEIMAKIWSVFGKPAEEPASSNPGNGNNQDGCGMKCTNT